VERRNFKSLRLSPTGWWLNSIGGVAGTCVAVAATSNGSDGTLCGMPVRAAGRPSACGPGVNTVNSIGLVFVGPGNIFPLVTLVGGMLTGIASILGWLLSSGHRPGAT
jgi:hypothetical protein